jgi:Zinc carboxypeptidase
MQKIMLGLILTFISFSSFAEDYDKILSRLQELSKAANTGLFTLGQNDQGKDIVGIVLGDPKTAIRKHLVIGTHHGDERAAAIVPFLFAELMLKDLDPEVLYYVIPVLNISGYNKNRRQEDDPRGSGTLDSNRDYEDACSVKVDFKLKSTSLIAEFVEREHIIAAVSVHGYFGTFTFPWGTDVKPFTTVDDALMLDWAKKAAKMNNYKVGTHGALVYPAAGAFEDWAYLKFGVWSYLLEIKSPMSDLNKDAQALVEFFKSAPSERSANVGQKVNCIKRLLSTRNRSRP